MVENDQRRHKLRIATPSLSAKLFVGVGKSATECVVPVRDFSQGGACVYVNFKVEPGTPIRLTIEELSGILLEGTVAWVVSTTGDNDAPPGAQFRIGLDFKAKDSAGKKNLSAAFEYVSKLADELDDAESVGE